MVAEATPEASPAAVPAGSPVLAARDPRAHGSGLRRRARWRRCPHRLHRHRCPPRRPRPRRRLSMVRQLLEANTPAPAGHPGRRPARQTHPKTDNLIRLLADWLRGDQHRFFNSIQALRGDVEPPAEADSARPALPSLRRPAGDTVVSTQSKRRAGSLPSFAPPTPMLIGILDNFNSSQLLIGLAVFFIAQMVFFRYMFGRLNSDPVRSSGRRQRPTNPRSSVTNRCAARSARRARAACSPPPGPRARVGGACRCEIHSGGREARHRPRWTKFPSRKSTRGTGKKSANRKHRSGARRSGDPYAPLPLAASEKPAPGPKKSIPLPTLVSPAKAETSPGKVPVGPLPVTAEAKPPAPLAAATNPVDKAIPAPTAPLTILPSAIPASPEPPAPKSPAEKMAMPSIPLPPLAVERFRPRWSPRLLPPYRPCRSSPSPKAEKAPTPVKPAPVEVMPVASIPRRLFVNPFAKAVRRPARGESGNEAGGSAGSRGAAFFRARARTARASH